MDTSNNDPVFSESVTDGNNKDNKNLLVNEAMMKDVSNSPILDKSEKIAIGKEKEDDDSIIKSDDNLVDKVVILSVLTLEHITTKNGRKDVVLLDEIDMFDYIKDHKVEEHMCKKDKLSSVQKKISCWPCTIVIESVQALRSHLVGTKHKENLDKPIEDRENFVLHNGKWKKRKGEKRPLGENNLQRMSKRERTKINKEARSIPILAQYTMEKYKETETYFEGGLRKVRPYHFTFTTHAKGRWVGDKLHDVFAREFRALPPEEYKRCIDAGLIKINDAPTTTDSRVENNDVISHVIHRHELPVTKERINIIHQDDDWVVVDKPSSIPVHPCGRYRHNSVIFILAKEENLPGLHTVHRLDRLTSGVLIFARSSGKAREMEMAITTRAVNKEYVARVVGEFPPGIVTCEEPIEVVSYKIGVCVVDPKGKQCKTTFERMDYRDGVSVVRCRPHTGRMHQIRVHLQYLGHPIVNDPLYNSPSFGPEKGKGGRLGKSQEQLIKDLMENHTIDNWIKTEEYEACKQKSEETEIRNQKSEKSDNDGLPDVPLDKNSENSCDPVLNQEEEVDDAESVIPVMDKKTVVDESDPYFDPNCSECRVQYLDPPPDTLVMYLHALRYSGEGWAYETKLPAWATLS